MSNRQTYIQARRLFVLCRTDWYAYRATMNRAPSAVQSLEQRLTHKRLSGRPWIARLLAK